MPSQVLLVSFAAGQRFEEAQQRLDASLKTAQIDAHWRWNSSSFEAGPHGEWYRRHAKVNFRRGGAWKPYIILQAMLSVREGDWVIYHDSSQYFPVGISSSVRPMLAWLESQRATNPCECIAAVRMRQQVQHEWLQRCAPPYGLPPGPEPPLDTLCGVLHRIGACSSADPSGVGSGRRDEECCAAIAAGPMLQHAWSIWRKGPLALQFLREWVLYSEDSDVLPLLPFVDQTLNELLVHKLHARLRLRVLWAPSLYTQHWTAEHDVANFGPMAFGRNDGTPFKHLNQFLDALYNQRITGKTYLWMLNLSSGGEEDESVSRLAWEASRAPPRLWRRSLCLLPEGRPPLAATVTELQLYLVRRGGGFGDRVPWGPVYYSPTAWSGPPVYAEAAPGDGPGVGHRALLGFARDSTEALGERLLYASGLSEAHVAGAWRCEAVPPWAARVILYVGVINDGTVPWPGDAGLCAAGGGNISFPFVRVRCVDAEGRVGPTCGAVLPNQRATLLLSVPVAAPRNGTGPGWREARWALCSPGDTRRFGPLLQAFMLPGRARHASSRWLAHDG